MAKKKGYIWAWGQKIEWKPDSQIAEAKRLSDDKRYLAQQNDGKILHPNNKQGRVGAAGILSIVLHCTAGNAAAKTTVKNWNVSARALAKYDNDMLEYRQEMRKWKAANGIGTKPKEPTHPKKKKSSSHFVLPRRKHDEGKDQNLLYRVVADAEKALHGNEANNTSLGVEIANAANEINKISELYEQAFDKDKHKFLDDNAYILLEKQVSYFWLSKNSALQAYQDEQYTQLILLLHFWCIKHEIPRQFLGKTTKEMFTQATEQQVKTFRGIMHHRNVKQKVCPGILHRNRIYRGLTDEWWPPVEMDGAPRTYYSGPFRSPPYVKGQKETKPAFFLWNETTEGVPDVTALPYKDTELDPLSEFKSYYDKKKKAALYAHCEDMRGGYYPVGLNRIWHGGVHFYPDEKNAAVYAAASGTIVAARIVNCEESTENTESTDTSEEREGSQCFVLLRHYVYPKRLADGRVDYKSSDPVPVFTLYMHLAPVASYDNEEKFHSPPWYDLWLRQGGTSEKANGRSNGKGRVFNPNIQVSVGDVLGVAGKFGKRNHVVHFEVLTSKKNRIESDDYFPADLQIDDEDSDIYCDKGKLDSWVLDNWAKKLEDVDIKSLSVSLRKSTALHKNEWSLKSAKALENVYKEAYPDDEDSALRKANADWAQQKNFMWWPEAMSACPPLKGELGEDGVVWHYHPLNFMEFVNDAVTAEYTAIPRLVASKAAPSDDAETDQAKIWVKFLAIRQESGTWQPMIDGRKLVYSCRANGYLCVTGSAMADFGGCTFGLKGSPVERKVPLDGALELEVYCDGLQMTASKKFTAESDPAWGVGVREFGCSGFNVRVEISMRVGTEKS